MMENALRLSQVLARLFKPCRDRLFEWAAAAIMLGIALMLFCFPNSIASGSYRYMLALGLTQASLMLVFLISGTLRMAALVANGYWRHGARLRALGALVGALMWFQMGCALVTFTLPNVPSVGLPVYVVLTVGELFAMARALTDARTYH